MGFGVKKFSLVWVFESASGLNSSINSGWELGGQASAAAKAGDKGWALPAPPSRALREGHRAR